MIIIENLTKKYKSQNNRTCTALDKINLTLPDSGMIFIIGKSGSGKSTLLNMIGGLDGFDGGEITADGNKLSEFRSKDFYKYRASYVGFIFQDYHLIEELTVEENIRLEAEIANDDHVDVNESLRSVDLEGYGARYPDELSGGQQQRVAIARALIKSPSVILCDEPTGNLDKNTSTQIMDLLKKISKERLVLVVSHNMPDAEKYADRIIELSSGCVISDLSRRENYTNTLSIDGGILTIPYNHNLTKEETDTITSRLKDGDINEILQNDGGYESTPYTEPTSRAIKLRHSRMKSKTVLSLFRSFSRGRMRRTATTAFISAVMVVLLIIFQSFLMFDGSRAIADSMKAGDNGSVVLRKSVYTDEYGNVKTNKVYKITDTDMAKVLETCGEDARIYKLYNFCIPTNLNSTGAQNQLELESIPSYALGTKHIYTSASSGTLVCDEEYLIRRFGENGKINVLAGDPYRTLIDGSVIITDYVADAMMMLNPTMFRSYDDIIGKIYEGAYLWGDVAAVISTGYKEKYKDLINDVASNSDKYSSGISLIEKESAISLMDDIIQNLAVSYSLNPNFIEAITPYNYRNYISMTGKISINGETANTGLCYAVTEDFNGVKVNEGEMLLGKVVFDAIFPDTDPQTLTFPAEITFEWTEWGNGKGEEIINKSYTVIGFSPTRPTIMAKADLEEFKALEIIPYSLYLENCDNINGVIDTLSEYGFVWASANGNSISLLNKSVNMFFDLFRLIETMILVMTVVFLISYSIRNVKANYYQIGVIKAIGGQSTDIGKIFVIQNVLTSVLICILTLLGSIVFIDVADAILIESFMQITKSMLSGIKIISFDIGLVLAAMTGTMLLGLVSTIAPLLLLHKIKPINIIKAKE